MQRAGTPRPTEAARDQGLHTPLPAPSLASQGSWSVGVASPRLGFLRLLTAFLPREADRQTEGPRGALTPHEGFLRLRNLGNFQEFGNLSQKPWSEERCPQGPTSGLPCPYTLMSSGALSPWRVVGSPFLPHPLAALGGGQGLQVIHSGLSLGGWRP